MIKLEGERNRSPYRGILVSCLVLIIVPLLLFNAVYTSIVKFDKTMTDDMRMYSSMMFGFGAGTCFNISCVLIGVLKADFKVVVKRIGNFFSNLFISPKIAFMCYKSELKEHGAAFWIYFLIMAIYVVLFAIGLRECLQFYLNFM